LDSEQFPVQKSPHPSKILLAKEEEEEEEEEEDGFIY
jgi:hypothetical protein